MPPAAPGCMTRQRGPSTDGVELVGVVTEQHLELADREFPGVARLYDRLRHRADPPRTFLDLLVELGAFNPSTAG